MASPLLPDPTADLNWSGFDKPIHEIFHSNALKHPDRPCVIETNPRREFTYQHMNEASNQLAHHFVKNGVQRGEVVMIYAYRGVDLVVAIMGVLKAGATFSVIDPAYPPDRQIIYLDVARPRALVVIKKAVEKAGGLAAKVTAWIAENLDLRTTVPELIIHDGGRLSGGMLGDSDVLADTESLKADLPGVVVGPDSTPTLSFTSGSEGRPKGVRGRHFSLVHYFPWMAQRFNLTENERFTMLSGIAHDPIQRDIFTPLFLGARLLVPSTEDIQNEKLAEWMRTYKATVTHLTPAMGQILVGGATAVFPDLKNAFFVGDILIKRDVRRLQELAPNVRTINMFGTTETQRAVSYYAIPSRTDDPEFLNRIGDKIPAGTGMQGVQLLVVDRTDRNKTCPVGEIGEIYVRAAGLAEGYLGLDDLTATKFVSNWFVDPAKWVEEDQQRQATSGHREPWREFYKGPRDRLYRSGDLGRYMPDGNVECTGRADDQVKIRGFRIELGEIDSHLSQHPIVRENVTLVRRDKDEEQILVSYIVPELSRWPGWLREKGVTDDVDDVTMVGLLKRFRLLREDARDYLKTKVPSYAVPTIIIPLSRMPLNPNGKIDKPALPFPNADELGQAAPRRASFAASSLSQTERKVATIWSELLDGIPAKTIAPNDSFFDLGGHSLIAQRMLLKVRKTWDGIDVLVQSIYDYPTLKGFAAELDRALDPQGRLLDLEGQEDGASAKQDQHYSVDAKNLASQLPRTFTAANFDTSSPLTILLTGATGFLGAYILRDLLSRNNPAHKVIAHVRAKDAEAATARVQQTCIAYGIWSPEWNSRLECIAGDLDRPNMGLSTDVWTRLSSQIDVVVHNGARVHWVTPYPYLRASNVLSTVAALELAAAGKPKQVVFISSTAVLEGDHYNKTSNESLASGGRGVPEDDDLAASAKGLGTGYGQSKWSSEFLMQEAGKRGLSGTIVRPGYILGDSKAGSKCKFVRDAYFSLSQVSCSFHHRRFPPAYAKGLRATLAATKDPQQHHNGARRLRGAGRRGGRGKPNAVRPRCADFRQPSDAMEQVPRMPRDLRLQGTRGRIPRLERLA